jgi:hypothetical protein
MNCQRIQTRLLYLETPDQPPPRIEAHLADCPACREWQRRLLQLERNASFLPVPASRSRDKFLAQFRSAPVHTPLPNQKRATADLPAILPLVRPEASGLPEAAPAVLSARRAHAWGSHKRWTVSAAAAAVLLVVLAGWWALSGPDATTGPKPAVATNPLLSSLLGCDLRLAEAGTPRERVEALADLADGLQDEMCTLVRWAHAEDIHTLAELYDQVVRDGVVANARALPAEQRRAVLAEVVRRLARAAEDANELAERVSPTAGGPLRLVAMAAHKGDHELRELLEERIP